MKILFAADMSFSKMGGYPGDDKAKYAMNEPAELFKNADFCMLNLENIFGRSGDGEPIIKSGPNLISDEEYIEYINVLKPAVVGLANNHTKDFGEKPMMNTIDILRKNGYTVIGAGKNIEEAYVPAKLSKDGVNVAIIAVCENEFGVATEDEGGVAGYNLQRVTYAIRDAIKGGCKPIIYFHGGNEYNPFPSPGKVDLYHHFIDIGAEAVIAMHTHCPQGFEMYNGKPVVYSMGNFYFPWIGEKYKSWMYGYLSGLEITENQVELKIYPYQFDCEKVTMLSGEEKEYFLKYMNCLNTPLADMGKIKSLFDSWCHTPPYSYLDAVTEYKAEMFADGYSREVVNVKNVFGCEAHNELITNSMNLIYKEKVEQTKKYIETIKKLQNMEIAEV